MISGLAIVIILGLVGLLVLLAIVVGLFVMFAYNKLVSLRNRFKNAYAQIDVQLKRRYDLIPNLVATAKGYLTHEKETLEAVIAARNTASNAANAAAASPGDPTAMRALSGAEAGLAGVLTRFMAVVEAYPNLKGDQHMERMMEELTSTENKVAFARQAFNDSVMTYNTARETFPTMAVAGILGFTPAEFFEIKDDAQREAPKVQF
jgi:LemA protein